MKRTKRRLHIPQHEFGFTPQAFNLFQDTDPTANALPVNSAEADRARRAAESAQPRLFTVMLPDDD